MNAIYPGTFDPITKGHIDIIQRATVLFDRLIVAIARNPQKKTLFSAEERTTVVVSVVQKIIKENRKKGIACAMNVELFDGLLATYANKKKARVIVRGLRAVSDFEYEFQLAITNKQLNPELETIFLMTDKQYFYMSSSLLKEIAYNKGNMSAFVPPEVEKALQKKTRKERKK